MVANKIKVNGVSIDLDQVNQLENIEALKGLEIFPENSDNVYQEVWDQAQSLKAKPVEPAKVVVEKPKKTKQAV